MIDIPKITRTSIDGQRIYTTPSGNKYPSVTTVLAASKDNRALVAWRKNIGEAKAAKVTAAAASEGTSIHKLCEQYVLGEPFHTVIPMGAKLTFDSIKIELDKCVTEVYGVETYLWSDKLKIAGQADLICKWNGIPSIVDFKRGERPKKPEYLVDYFVQESCYSMMMYERTGIICPQLVIVVGLKDSPAPQIVISNIKDKVPTLDITWAQLARNKIDYFYQINKHFVD